ncbi:hypothetical protein GUJ93_ZPchr0005g16328 [Zizania palustris]|uniref:Uncharacterized protein n=1 Tax=Zizania palustris TaxID=103762 RepID=A0A8J5SYF3_ZIZPA|nr:hypothetical protein GUJ93_ZPchr0005g16328 [Zizania palustris]
MAPRARGDGPPARKKISTRHERLLRCPGGRDGGPTWDASHATTSSSSSPLPNVLGFSSPVTVASPLLASPTPHRLDVTLAATPLPVRLLAADAFPGEGEGSLLAALVRGAPEVR